MTSHIPASADLRLIAVDMDGTLLDGEGRIPDALWPLLQRLTARGIAFAPASGRQFATLRRDFGAFGDDMMFIAENGSFVSRGDEPVSVDSLDTAVVADIVTRMRGVAAKGTDLGVVVCGVRSAYVERGDERFLEEVRKYYARLSEVDDLLAVQDQIVKVAIFTFGNSEADVAPTLVSLQSTHQVVVSGERWLDVMNLGVNKGRALRALQAELGVTPAQTAAFGDYLNDVELLDAAELSFAMADAHPDLVAHARFRAPSNRDHGVIAVLEQLLG